MAARVTSSHFGRTCLFAALMLGFFASALGDTCNSGKSQCQQFSCPNSGTDDSDAFCCDRDSIDCDTACCRPSSDDHRTIIIIAVVVGVTVLIIICVIISCLTHIFTCGLC